MGEEHDSWVTDLSRIGGGRDIAWGNEIQAGQEPDDPAGFVLSDNTEPVSDYEGTLTGPTVRAAPEKKAPSKNQQAGSKAKPPETDGHKEASWVHPSESGDGLKHVGMIYFRSNQSDLDENDKRLLKELAGAYAKGSRSGKQRTAVSGRIDAYADPRPSKSPGNPKLSALRAKAVRDELARAFVDSDITSGVDAIVPRGLSVHPDAPKKLDEDAAEGNLLAPFRRAEIYLQGKADVTPVPVKQQVEVPDKAPDYSDRPHGFDKFGIQVSHGDREIIHGLAIQILSNSFDDGFTSGPDANLEGRLKMAGIVPVKPKWWATRQPTVPMGRGGPEVWDRDSELVKRAKQMIFDYKLFANFAKDREADEKAFWGQEPKAEVVERLGQLLFMLQEVVKEAHEVEAMSK